MKSNDDKMNAEKRNRSDVDDDGDDNNYDVDDNDGE